ncbi:hypothetical protein [Streptomyces sp. NPDC006879]|uniref:hypothetical protein n=1 Tax=Streptomyces sp. NPDC006879 TaxID=3364767 RepID=UPI0036ACCD7A
MRPAIRRSAAAAFLAAALTLTACSSGGDDQKDSAAPGTPAPAVSAPDPATETAPPTSRPTDAKPTGPVLADDEIKPVTGSFTKKEKDYLKGRVPKKTDPAAVLQTGQEACQRIERTAKRDKDAAASAIISGDIPGAADAVRHLCPDQKPVLEAAEGGFADGTHKDLTPGSYRALSPTDGCTWQAKGSGDKSLAAGPELGAKPGDQIIAKIPAGTVEFVSTGCYAWVRA